tara:strand:- start:446 stop:1561 length:1116 start_codon:yes stop_codon:yes gene_type:complete
MRNILIFAIALFLSTTGLNVIAKDGPTEIPLVFSGYVHTATTYNLGDNEDESNNYHTFSDDDYTMTPSAQIGVSNDHFVIDALFGSIAEDLNDNDSEFFLHQAYGIIPLGAWTVMVGHFDTMLGNEVINPGDNPNITRSFLFGYTINFQNTGIRAMYEPVTTFIDEIYVGVGNGWDTIYDEGENQEKTFEAAFGSTMGSASLFVAMNYGQETDDQTRQTYTAVLGMPISNNLSLTVNGVIGKGEEEGAYTSVVTGVADDDTWHGFGSYLTYSYDQTKSITGRFEYLKNPGGGRLGFASTNANTWTELTDDAVLKSVTITPELLIGDYGILRAEYRYDIANHPVFQVLGGAAGDQAQNKTQETVSLQYVVSF